MSEDVTIRAARAHQLLEDEVLKEAMEAIHQDALFRSIQAKLNDPAECIAAIAAIQAADAIHDKLIEFVTSGKAAERKPYKVA